MDYVNEALSQAKLTAEEMAKVIGGGAISADWAPALGGYAGAVGGTFLGGNLGGVVGGLGGYALASYLTQDTLMIEQEP